MNKNQISHHIRDGKKYIVINDTSWYPEDKWTEETSLKDYIFTHSNNGWNFVPRFRAR